MIGLIGGGINPLPKRRIPIYCGGFSEAAFKRAAKLADGFNFGGGIDVVTENWRKTRQFLAEEEREAEGFGAEFQLGDVKGTGLATSELVDAAKR